MRIFVTGASGHIGSAVVPELIEAGHSVLGLARSDSSAAALAAAGAEVQRGELSDLDGLRAGAATSDGVIHLAFRHDLVYAGGFQEAAESELHAVHALGQALQSTDKPFVTTSGTLMLSHTGLGTRRGTELDVVEGGPRVDAENATIELASHGVRSSVVRLSPLVHSTLDHHGFAPTLIQIAREKGVSAYVGDGNNRWPAVHTLDAAHLYRLAVEAAPAGTRLHGVADEGVPFRLIATAIGDHLNLPVAAISSEEAEPHFGFLAPFVVLDNETSSERTRELLGWEPANPGLLDDLNEGHYFS